jgi:hypothetical protein
MDLRQQDIRELFKHGGKDLENRISRVIASAKADPRNRPPLPDYWKEKLSKQIWFAK